MHLSHKTSQKVKVQQSFQDPTNFVSWASMILKMLTVFSEKMVIAIFWYFTKIDITQVKNDPEN